MLGSQSAGARLLSKHLEREEAKKQQAIRLPEKSASELLKEGKGLSKKQSSQETSDEDQSSKPVKHAGPVLEPESSFSDNSAVFSSRKRQSAGMNDQGTETDSFPLTNSSKLLPPPHKKKPQLRELERDVCQRSGSNSMSPFQPRLGRGLVPGSVLDLVSSHSPSSLSQRRQSATKLKAVAILRQKQNESSTDDILYRVEENRADTAHHLPAEGVSREEEEEQGPLSKRRKLDPAEVEMILNAKSSHEWAAREVEWEKEEQYFSQHEKKENMEQRLSSITELHVYVSQCKQCNYVAEQPSDLCRKEAHRLTRYKAVKRWFECQECRERCCAYNARYPPLACRKCNGQVYKQTSMFRERKGPKVGAENLLLRGREEKFLN